MKVMTIIGARPQFVKAAVVSRAFKERRPDVKEIIVHTGQHYDTNMSDVFFEELEIPRPDYNLGVGGGTHGQNTGRMIEKLEKLMIDERPNWVVVYGDTDSTLAGGVAASKLHIPVAHVEAGLRSFNRRMPEEINRILTDHVSDLLFAPTETSQKNLLKEGVPEGKIKLVGDVMYDAALYYKDRAKKPVFPHGFLIEDEDFVLCTIHRAENTDDLDKLESIYSGLEEYGRTIVLPLHPRTRSKILESEMVIPDNVWHINPVGYLGMVWLEANARLIVTDSGGIQKEAYFHGKNCVTLREETEWSELVESGWNTLVGTNPGLIAKALLEHQAPMSKPFYGDGDTALQIVNEVCR